MIKSSVMKRPHNLEVKGTTGQFILTIFAKKKIFFILYNLSTSSLKGAGVLK